ncbi:MAG: glycosyltransferase family 1 protein [Eubacteriales bacterium]|nr:glycosyltransferase family 1 protein [Eubacteriales bacterium]
MYNVLVFGMTENPGGVESFLMNYYRRINPALFHFDFLCNSYNPVAYEEEILQKGGRTIHFTSRRENPIRFHRELGTFFKEHAGCYDAIWVNVNSLANIDYLKMAKKYGIPKRIIHSHNAQNMDTKLRGLLHEANRGQVGRYATDFWACSKYAAKWFYAGRGGKGKLRHPAVIIRNAIDVGKIQSGIEKRGEIRAALGWEDAYIMTCVGRLHFQKNQKFAVDVLAELLPVMPDARLLLIGQGEDEAMLRAHVKARNVEAQVCFAGVVEDVSGYLGAADFFLFPSVFEGLGIAGLEAQAAGLPTLAAKDVIPQDIAVTDLLRFCPLEAGPGEWARQVRQIRSFGQSARPAEADSPVFGRIRDAFRRKGYDSVTEVRRLEKLLMK